MEDNNDYFDIYYQYNSYDEIKEENLNKTNKKQKEYFLIESIKDINSFTFDKLENLLINDGVDKSKIDEYRFLCKNEKKGNIHYYTKSLSSTNFGEFLNSNEKYLHLIIKENDPNAEDPILKEMDEYIVKIAKASKNVEILSSQINKEKYTKKKVSNILSNIKENFYLNNSFLDLQRSVHTEIKAPNMTKNGIPDNILYNSINENDINNISSEENNDSLAKSSNYFPLKKVYSMQIQSNTEKGKEKILCYLYANPLVNEDNKNTYKDTDYFDEMVTIIDIFKNSSVSAQLAFEPLNYNLNAYLERSPDILHIKVKSIKEQRDKIKFEFDFLGEVLLYKLSDLKNAINSENDRCQIELLILSSQNIKDIQKHFTDLRIKNIIYIENKMEKKDYPLPNEVEETFIKEFYYYILIEGLSIQDAYKKIKGNYKDKIVLDISNPHGKDYLVPFKNIGKSKNSSKNLIMIEKKENFNIKLNKNCSLNLDYVKYNYRRIIGRNSELKNCIKKMKIFNNVCIYGYPGVGKKCFAQNAGKFAFERKMYKEVHFITIYNLGDAHPVLENKIKNIKLNIKNDENQMEIDNELILLIIYYDKIISEERDIKIFEEIIRKLKDNNIKYLFVFTIAKNFRIERVKHNLYDTPTIELNKLDYEKRMDLFNLISYKRKITKNKIKELVNMINGYPNDIFLLVLFTSCFNDYYNIVKNMKQDKNTLEKLIFTKFIEKFGEKMKKVLSIFTILRLGIRGDILNKFFKEEEINFIENTLDLLIYVENDEKGKNYIMDSSFRSLVKSILMENYKEEFLIYLCFILKNYALIFRYLVHSNKSKTSEFHAAIHSYFWFSVNEKKIRSQFKTDFEQFKKSSPKIYFDEVKYFINIYDLFSDKDYFDLVKSNIDKFIEYISQISICLPTKLHLNNNTIYTNALVLFFEEKLVNLKLYRSLLRLKIFKYWLSEDSNLLPKESDLAKIASESSNEKGAINNDIYAEFYLIKIYDYARKKKNQDITHIYNKCKEYCKNNKFNLEKLEYLKNELQK